MPASRDAPSEVPLREPHLFRFSMRRMFVAASAVIVMCGVARVAPGTVSWAILAAGALVVAHFFGAILGTQLRDTSDDVQAWSVNRGLDRPLAEGDRSGGVRPFEPPRQTPLAGHHANSARRGKWAAVAGFVLGGFGGGGGILAVGGREITWLGAAIVAVSCGVLAAWSALLASGFWVVGRHAWKDATRGDHKSLKR